jgi:hypothetical protein
MAEYCAISTIIKEGIILAKLAADLTLSSLWNEDNPDTIPLLLYCDSDNAIRIVTNSKLSTKVLWISTRYHLVRDLVKRDLIALINILSKKNAADILTKAKPHGVFEEDRDQLLCMTRPLDCSN